MIDADSGSSCAAPAGIGVFQKLEGEKKRKRTGRAIRRMSTAGPLPAALAAAGVAASPSAPAPQLASRSIAMASGSAGVGLGRHGFRRPITRRSSWGKPCR